MMIKATQIRNLTDENNLLKKHLNKLKEKEENKVKFNFMNFVLIYDYNYAYMYSTYVFGWLNNQWH